MPTAVMLKYVLARGVTNKETPEESKSLFYETVKRVLPSVSHTCDAQDRYTDDPGGWGHYEHSNNNQSYPPYLLIEGRSFENPDNTTILAYSITGEHEGERPLYIRKEQLDMEDFACFFAFNLSTCSLEELENFISFQIDINFNGSPGLLSLLLPELIDKYSKQLQIIPSYRISQLQLLITRFEKIVSSTIAKDNNKTASPSDNQKATKDGYSRIRGAYFIRYAISYFADLFPLLQKIDDEQLIAYVTELMLGQINDFKGVSGRQTINDVLKKIEPSNANYEHLTTILDKIENLPTEINKKQNYYTRQNIDPQLFSELNKTFTSIADSIRSELKRLK